MKKDKVIPPKSEVKAYMLFHNATKAITRRRRIDKARRHQVILYVLVVLMAVMSVMGAINNYKTNKASNRAIKIYEGLIITQVEWEYDITQGITRAMVQDEIIKQSILFGVDTQRALDLAQCESGFNYKAKNPNSTARGVYQYLIGTWEETESAKMGLERNDYKANIREAMLDLANGQANKWNDSCRF